MSDIHSEPLTFEKVWAALMENREQMKETARSIKEVSERQKETDRQMKETDRKIGRLGNRFGELAEHLVAPGSMEKFNAIGFHFTRTSRNHELKDPKTGRSLAEVDIILENGDIVIAVEVKSKPDKQDVDDHIKRMGVLRRVADSKEDRRKYRGAIAGAIVSEETRGYAQTAGFYVLEQSGDTMKLEIPEGFVPRDW
jgi:hypothetical protein